MAQIAKRPGEDEEHDEQDAASQPVDPHELVIDRPDGRRFVVKLPDIAPPRAEATTTPVVLDDPDDAESPGPTDGR
jgi:hypothetical protein